LFIDLAIIPHHLGNHHHEEVGKLAMWVTYYSTYSISHEASMAVWANVGLKFHKDRKKTPVKFELFEPLT